MKFTNKSDDRRDNDRLNIHVGAGEDLDVDTSTEAGQQLAAGLALQCGEDGAWAPADDEAQQLVDGAVADYEASIAPPPPEPVEEHDPDTVITPPTQTPPPPDDQTPAPDSPPGPDTAPDQTPPGDPGAGADAGNEQGAQS